MLAAAKKELAKRLEARVQEHFGVDYSASVEVPPRRELGDLALTAGLELARTLGKNPRAIGQELAEGWSLPPWVREVQVAGPGFLNIFFDRSATAARLLAEPVLAAEPRPAEKVIVEHTNINPNKAAHIGHLRNAVLGDALSRALRALGHPVEVQNYIDDTGVQLADVVVALADMRGLTLQGVREMEEPFDYACWDLYSEVGRWYEEDPSRRSCRQATLHELESGIGERAELGRLVARRVVGRHLGTMRRLGIGYDLLTHESSILQLEFFTQAFERLKEREAIQLETGGKNEGCWVMPLATTREFAGLEDPDKVIVRSDGTVTYTGKDIAYQLWKLGRLGRDFGYLFWDEQAIWESTPRGVGEHPAFGAAWKVINVIDARQSYLQQVVRAGLERLGLEEEAERSIHFAYEMVSLSRAAARQLGVLDEADGTQRLEMSGRKGIGVKADDLLDQLEAKSREEISARNQELAAEELERLSQTIAAAALRFFMIRATTNRVIAFDFDEALNFEGDSGPYLLYSLVRAQNIRRRLVEAGLDDTVTPEQVAALPAELWDEELWDLVYAVAQIPERVEAAVEGLELSVIARHALELAQRFNTFYHKHPILQEPDPELRTLRLAVVSVFSRGLTLLVELMGFEIPERM
jgi:arginyl-tRNA synthetase